MKDNMPRPPPVPSDKSLAELGDAFCCHRSAATTFMDSIRSWRLINYTTDNLTCKTGMKFLAGWLTDKGFVPNKFSTYNLFGKSIVQPKSKKSNG